MSRKSAVWYPRAPAAWANDKYVRVDGCWNSRVADEAGATEKGGAPLGESFGPVQDGQNGLWDQLSGLHKSAEGAVGAANFRAGVHGHGSASGGTRTPNLLVRSQLLYPIELRMRNANAESTPGAG